MPAYPNDPGYTRVQIDLHEHPNEYTNNDISYSGYGGGKDFEEAMVIAMRRFLGNKALA